MLGETDYHTALKPDVTVRPELVHWQRDGNMAFVHDVNHGIPEVMKACDVIYSELPWADGYMEFLRRAGCATGIALPYEKWLFRLSVSLARFGKPFVMVAGLSAVRHMACEWFMPVQLNGSLSMAFGAGIEPPPPGKLTATDMLLWTVAGARIIGDPCCGFGRTARVAYDEGKKFICSDINLRCIGTLASMIERA